MAVSAAESIEQWTLTADARWPMQGWLLHVLLFGMVASHAFDYVHTDLFKADSRRTKVCDQRGVGVCSHDEALTPG